MAGDDQCSRAAPLQSKPDGQTFQARPRPAARKMAANAYRSPYFPGMQRVPFSGIEAHPVQKSCCAIIDRFVDAPETETLHGRAFTPKDPPFLEQGFFAIFCPPARLGQDRRPARSAWLCAIYFPRSSAAPIVQQQMPERIGECSGIAIWRSEQAFRDGTECVDFCTAAAAGFTARRSQMQVNQITPADRNE